jgi:nicotinate phosphoribosyltransferase
MTSDKFFATNEDQISEAQYLSGGLDYYKLTMSQLEQEKYPDAIATFTYINRDKKRRLADYVDVGKLRERLETRRVTGWHPDEIRYFAGLKNSDSDRIFSDDFLNFIKTNSLPPVDVVLNPATNDLAISTTGAWPLVTFWETVLMSDLSEMYMENYMLKNGLNPLDVYEEGDRRLSAAIEILRANPDIKLAEFGTRRRFSLRWHKHVLDRLMNEVPENLLGTSNVAFAATMGLAPIGTYAHELPMGYAAIAEIEGRPILESQGEMLDDWLARYGRDLAIALSDTFGTDVFLQDFGSRAANWRGIRQDSGDPLTFGEKIRSFLEMREVSPQSYTMLFSDNLTMDKVVTIQNHFSGQADTPYGIGTSLTNNLGFIKPLNGVAKMTNMEYHGQAVSPVKLSDDPGKHTGTPEAIERYQDLVRERLDAAEQIRIDELVQRAEHFATAAREVMVA